MQNLFKIFEMPGALAFLILVAPFENPAPVNEPLTEDYLSSFFFDCPQDSADKDGRSTCSRIFPDGSQLLLSTAQESFGSDVKLQTQSVTVNSEGKALKQETLRKKTVYAPGEEGRLIKKELFDIVQNEKGLATRDLVVYEFHPRTHKPKNIIWSRYEQTEPGKLAKITRYLSLSYTARGRLLKSQSHSWTYPSKPVKTKTFSPRRIFRTEPV